VKEPPQILEALEPEVVLGHGDEEHALARKESEPSQKEEIADKIRGVSMKRCYDNVTSAWAGIAFGSSAKRRITDSRSRASPHFAFEAVSHGRHLCI